MIFFNFNNLFANNHATVENKSESTEKKEWLEPLIENIEKIKERGSIVPFDIVDIQKDWFLIKTNGLYAYVPFDCMPWTYSNTKCWEAIFFSLEKKKFFGKVFRIDRKPDKPGHIRIFVDATTTLVKEAKLYHNKDYRGIVILKTAYGVFVDIGYHFHWRCGSLTGLFHRSKFPDHESFLVCEPGQIVVVNYFGENEKGMIFEKEGYIDLNEKYTGKTVRVKVYRYDDGTLDFLVEGKYNAKMPVNQSIYDNKKTAMQYIMDSWIGGEFIDCEVLHVIQSKERFILKYLFPENHIINNIGETIQVNVYRSQNGSLYLLSEDKYKVEMPVTKSIYGKRLNMVKKAMKYWQGNETIICQVIDIDFTTELLQVKWTPNTNIANYIGRTVQVKITRKKKGKLDLKVDDKIKAEMPFSKTIYGKKHLAMKNLIQYFNDEIISCIVVDIEAFTETLIVKWLPDKTIWNRINWNSNIIRNYIGKRVYVSVCKDEDDQPEFFVEDIYPAKLSYESTAIFNSSGYRTLNFCKVESVNAQCGHFVVIWEPLNKEKYQSANTTIATILDETVFEQLKMKLL